MEREMRGRGEEGGAGWAGMMGLRTWRVWLGVVESGDFEGMIQALSERKRSVKSVAMRVRFRCIFSMVSLLFSLPWLALLPCLALRCYFSNC